LSGFLPNEHNCTTFGIFALHGFWSHIFPGNKRKYPGKKRKYPSVKTRASVNIKSQNERKSKKNCYEQKKVVIEDPGIL